MDEKVAPVSKIVLPAAFVEFLHQNGLDPSIYIASQSIPRYIRLKPGCGTRVTEIEEEVKCKIRELSWLPNFYFLPPDVHIASTKGYQEGKIYGIDAASGASVIALNVSPGDHILDLCAAPGAKLCMILDLIGCSGSVTGVDVARHRLAASRTMLQKYGQVTDVVFSLQMELFSPLFHQGFSQAVSCVMNLIKHRLVGMEEESEIYKEWTHRRPYKERKRVAKARENVSRHPFVRNQDPELIFYGRNSGVVGLRKSEVFRSVDDLEILQFGYDKVFVDAECTHDGSVRHIQKFEQWGWETLSRRVLDAERTDDVTVLQLKLLTNGFRLLKAGGFLVYSTCSLTVAQNEDVVEQFLSQNLSAELVEIEDAKGWPCSPARTPKTLRFDPSASFTSGLFIAKFTKLTIR
ncbi:receptor-like protein kinase 4 isoform 1 [Dorcoceras hygrometricum]|uniref:Receptor-like protein kinase 4 isoform 1 n=1 Tax=Dorcoceras hygrometricum TaxID=472368 RepID=A0A2Z7CJA5_9LAMI|nr:receptor-like protein kinase 4 isoform 1 [Dorcoceras hygrometricum]